MGCGGAGSVVAGILRRLAPRMKSPVSRTYPLPGLVREAPVSSWKGGARYSTPMGDGLPGCVCDHSASVSVLTWRTMKPPSLCPIRTTGVLVFSASVTAALRGA